MNNVFHFHDNLPLLPPPHHLDGASTSSSAAKRHQKPRKKRAKHLQNAVVSAETGPGQNIARSCSECGKKFWSWKALFGHMRCHPERHWRGINPPPNHHQHHRRPASDPIINDDDDDLDEYEIAACLLLLANNGTPNDTYTRENDTNHDHRDDDDDYNDDNNDVDVAFECSSCKKVFRSHQALGGHRASHKNVKGCFAMARSTSNSSNINGLDFDLNLPAVLEVEDHNLGFCLMSSSNYNSINNISSSSPGLANLDLRLGL